MGKRLFTVGTDHEACIEWRWGRAKGMGPGGQGGWLRNNSREGGK